MKTSIGWRKRIALFLAAMVASLGAVTAVSPSPAAAATSIRYCFTMWIKSETGLWLHEYICIDVPLAYNRDWFPDYGIDIRTDYELPLDIQRQYLGSVAEGLSLVGQAQRARDPRTAAALRSRAQTSFLAAAGDLRDSRAALYQVGVADVANLRFSPQPDPWLARAGVDIADGLALMTEAIGKPEPDPWLEAGMREFEVAYDQLEAPRAG